MVPKPPPLASIHEHAHSGKHSREGATRGGSRNLAVGWVTCAIYFPQSHSSFSLGFLLFRVEPHPLPSPSLRQSVCRDHHLSPSGEFILLDLRTADALRSSQPLYPSTNLGPWTPQEPIRERRSVASISVLHTFTPANNPQISDPFSFKHCIFPSHRIFSIKLGSRLLVCDSDDVCWVR